MARKVWKRALSKNIWRSEIMILHLRYNLLVNACITYFDRYYIFEKQISDYSSIIIFNLARTGSQCFPILRSLKIYGGGRRIWNVFIWTVTKLYWFDGILGEKINFQLNSQHIGFPLFYYFFFTISYAHWTVLQNKVV